ncbi:hypothetical protein MSG28_008160 [Choristoneura fumiferana]|uniref:Uncharacterized protein n=1 Tax=Choristoneura fumiferana TaxID=7141 RepID=A0ACC0JA72_CHOFU|nr:hypothetical protein MSG28_008160 [Choristoneura fumiferana]
MVFSQTSHKTQSILKVVEIDRLKQEKPQVDSLTGVITDGRAAMLQPTCSFTEDYLKPEPVFESNMYHDTDCEFFQDLVGWCSDPAKEELVQTIDSPKLTEDRAYNTDTLPNQFSPQGWDGFDANSPAAQASFYNNTPKDPLSPVEGAVGFDTKFTYNLDLENERSLQMQEQFLDISSLPVVIGGLASADAGPWAAPAYGWAHTEYTKPITNAYTTLPFIDHEDSLDMKYMRSVTPREVESGVVSEFVVEPRRRPPALDVAARPALAHALIPSTPEVLSYVEQLEQEKYPLLTTPKTKRAPTQTETFLSPLATATAPAPAPHYSPVTPKSESHESEEEAPRARRRRRSEDSDETYTPEPERASPRKYKRRKPNIKEMIVALEGSQQLPKARRGRPPKRRDSTVSSVCSVDENSSTLSTQEYKYRELRDKNNEASKRSRMHRKLKELQMEQMADELEERNKKLKVKADILEDMTKRLKDALMKSILQK